MSALPNPESLLFSSEEYLEMERAAETKSEYYDGEIVAMSGGTPDHAAIAANLIIALGSQLRGKPCRAYSSDLKIAEPSGKVFAYPDVSIVCGKRKILEGTRDVVTNPSLIVEVLSPSTGYYDRDLKFYYYRRIESFTDYLLVSQEKPYVEHHHKVAEGRWEVVYAEGLEASVEISAIGVVLRLSDAYEKIEFSTPDNHEESANDPQ